MAISNEKKKAILLENFEILKDDYDKNGGSLVSAVVKMLKIDANTAVDMWSYLVTKYIAEVKSEYSWSLTSGIVYNGGKAIGEEQMGEIVLKNPVLKTAIFAQAGGDIGAYVCEIVGRRINQDDLQTADELFTLLYKNKNKNNSWYEIMDNIIPDDPDDLNVTEEGYELLEMWCDKVKDKEERARLNIKLMEFMV